jgi:uncharacterized protein involved in exopolysaccharide biosynthesis
MKVRLTTLSFIFAASTLLAEPSANPKQPPPPPDKKTSDIATELAAAKQELAKMRERYQDQHPSVKAQLRKIADLERRLAEEKAAK